MSAMDLYWHWRLEAGTALAARRRVPPQPPSAATLAIGIAQRNAAPENLRALQEAGATPSDAEAALAKYQNDVTCALAHVATQAAAPPALPELCGMLEDMGFPKAECLAALARYRNDLDLAAGYLLETCPLESHPPDSAQASSSPAPAPAPAPAVCAEPLGHALLGLDMGDVHVQRLENFGILEGLVQPTPVDPEPTAVPALSPAHLRRFQFVCVQGQVCVRVCVCVRRGPRSAALWNVLRDSGTLVRHKVCAIKGSAAGTNRSVDMYPTRTRN